MNRITLLAIVVLVVIGAAVGAFFLMHRNVYNTFQPTQPSGNQSGSVDKQATGTSFTINADDNSATPSTLNVKKGNNISVTFKVNQDGVYHGGLEFKSDVVSSGPIAPGESKTVTFTADQSFDFTPYWYQSQVKKDYLIHVVVS